MNAPWRHHSVPQFVLRNFADAGGLLYHYTKVTTGKGISHVGPKGIFFGKHLYSTVDLQTGELDASAEIFFDKEVENPTAPTIQKIIASVRIGKKPGLTGDEKQRLDLFLQYQFRRAAELARKYAPAYQTAVSRTIADLELEYGPLPQEVKDEIRNPASPIAKGAIVGAQVRASADVAAIQRIRGLMIAVIADPKKAFIIGSNPMVPFPEPGFREFGVPGFWMPISSDVAISLGGPEGTEDLRSIVDHRRIRRVNELSFEQSDEIAGRSRVLIGSLINRRRRRAPDGPLRCSMI